MKPPPATLAILAFAALGMTRVPCALLHAQDENPDGSLPRDAVAAGARRPSSAAPFTVEQNQDWAPYAHSVEIAPGGVFDFSTHVTAHAPAGKYGPVIIMPDGHLAFRDNPARRFRFWGVNLCFTANYPEPDEAERLAERFVRSGYNTVRFHHFDSLLVREGGNSWELDPQKLDRLDRFFAALKKRGIYINIDLFSSRGFSPAEIAAFGFPQNLPSSRIRGYFKSCIPINDAVFESWKKFATNLLTHKNPHTGLTWAGDPALIGICPVNEDSLFRNVLRYPEVRARYETEFEASRGGVRPGGETPEQREAAFARFVYDTHARYDARIFAHLRSLGVGAGAGALVTGANYTLTQGLQHVRNHYDYVDTHAYWAHPEFPQKTWSFPTKFRQDSPVKAPAATPKSPAGPPFRVMPARIPGKPFTVTELNYCRPNQYRASGAVLTPAYAGLQDWDALYTFHYALSREMALGGGVENCFALACDPIGIIGDRVGALLFQRGDIAPAMREILWAARPDEAFTELQKRFPDDFCLVGLVSRIGSLPGQPAAVWSAIDGLDAVVTGAHPAPATPFPAKTYPATKTLLADLQRDGVLPPGSVDPAGRHFTSDTRQIELHAGEGSVKVVTPRGELFYAPKGTSPSGDRVTLENVTADAAISVIAIDDAPLAGTRRILVTHLTDALPEGMQFEKPDRKLLLSWGKGPHLVRRGDATLTLRLPAGDWKAWAVDATGARTREIPLREKGGQLAMTLATVTPEGTQLAYELARHTPPARDSRM
ncbi:MAG: glycosyl hydrolase family 5 [Opitutaceae bacterium]|jgi:hypothetical protein|nr:glycosyl hydrolase family 5 [Opitutaceae bacterium]